MNYLAHLWLADVSGTSLAGAVLGDWVRGPVDERFPVPLARGIRLHRRVDAATDRHPLVRAAKRRFPPDARRYAGIVLDLLYDYLLARQWPRHSAEPLVAFARRAATAVALETDAFALVGRDPPPAAAFAELLLSYATSAGLERAIARTARRLSRPEGLLAAARDWQRHAEAAADELPALLRDLRSVACEGL